MLRIPYNKYFVILKPQYLNEMLDFMSIRLRTILKIFAAYTTVLFFEVFPWLYVWRESDSKIYVTVQHEPYKAANSKPSAVKYLMRGPAVTSINNIIFILGILCVNYTIAYCITNKEECQYEKRKE